MSSETPSEKLQSVVRGAEHSLTARLEKIRCLERKYSVRRIATQPITDALLEAGCISLDAQAKALGVSRSTAWTIVKAKHKLGRLNNKTALCILANPDTPASVRAVIGAMLQASATLQFEEQGTMPEA